MALLSNPRKVTVLILEIHVMGIIGGEIKQVGRFMEGDGYIQLLAYPRLWELEEFLKNPLDCLIDLPTIASAAPPQPRVPTPRWPRPLHPPWSPPPGPSALPQLPTSTPP